jgi:hypothetical protein
VNSSLLPSAGLSLFERWYHIYTIEPVTKGLYINFEVSEDVPGPPELRVDSMWSLYGLHMEFTDGSRTFHELSTNIMRRVNCPRCPRPALVSARKCRQRIVKMEAYFILMRGY